MSDQEVRLQAIIDWLEHGRITTQQAASRIRSMSFGAPEDQTAGQVRRADALGDSEPPGAGSFFPVAAAFAAGRIDKEQYAALAQAAAEAMKPVSGA